LGELTKEKETGYTLWMAMKRMKKPVVHIPPIDKQDGSGQEMMNKKLERRPTDLVRGK
jgi:hypothetical protein